MKNQFKFLIIILLCGFQTMIAQESNTTETSKSTAGIKAGYNLASVAFDGEGDTDHRNGFHVGFYGESFATNFLAVQLELLYSQQGYEIESDAGTFKQKLNYINLPILIKIYPISNFYFEAGPQVGLAISHKEEFDSEFNLLDSEREFDPRSFDYGTNIGLGVKTDSGFGLGTRYYFGLGDIYDEGNPRNRVLQISASFAF